MNPSYTNPQEIELAFDLSHEGVKGEHNSEQIRQQSHHRTTTIPSTVTSTASSEKHVVASIFSILTFYSI